ncbi:MAG: T9SS type A sorting domain-containing protein [Flavobacterium sp.]
MQDITVISQLVLNSTKPPKIKLSIQYGLQQAQLDASALANGIYIIVLTDKNNKVQKQKFVKE